MPCLNFRKINIFSCATDKPRTAVLFAIASIFVNFICAAQTVIAEDKIVDQYFVHPNLVYATSDDRQLKLDLYLPNNKQSSKLIIWVHGGAWHRGSKAKPPVEVLNGEYALASVEYRLSGEATFPAQVHDIKAAIRFLRAHANKYGFERDRFAIWGASAGGHLASLVGLTNNHAELEGNLGKYTHESSSIELIIDCYGPTNFISILAQSTNHGLSVRAPALALLLGGVIKSKMDQANLASPVNHVDKSDPPLLIMHGDQDIQVPINQSHELHGLYKESKRPVEFYVAHGIGHKQEVFKNKPGNEILMAFLKKYF